RAAARAGDWLRLPLGVVIGLTHVLRRRAVTLAAVLGLGASLAIVMAFLLVQETRRAEVEGHVRRMALDATVHFHEPVGTDVLEDLARRTEGTVEPFFSQRAVLVAGGQQSVRRVLLIAPGAWVEQQRLVAGRPFRTPDEPVLLVDRWLARTHGLALGARVAVFPSPDAPEGAELEVVGILEGVTQGFAVLPLGTGAALYDVPGLAEGAHLRSSLPPDELEQRAWAGPDVEAAFVLARAAGEVQAIFAATAAVLRAVLWMALAVALLFLAVLAGIDAAERAPDFAVLRALGWRTRGLAAVCMTEVLTRGTLALAVAIPLAPVLGALLLRRLAAAHFPTMQLASEPWVYLLVGGAALATWPLGGLPALRTATRVSPARALRRLGTE
ncbi:MAG: hypothetical protein O2894_11220, partial [Planctomycetota bacterium]|nr:hypothetical protein [Planctomycetota bacterium]